MLLGDFNGPGKLQPYKESLFFFISFDGGIVCLAVNAVRNLS